MKTAFTLILLLLTSCTSDNKSTPHLVVHEICGREHTPLYRIKAPSNWQIKKPIENEPLEDTKKSICEFFIHEESNEIRITIHNFPSTSLDERIPPTAQIFRWKKQFNEINPLSLSITPQSFAGFVGSLFEATGKINEVETTMLAWSMQLAPLHYRNLDNETKSCITIKVTGNPERVEKNRNAIIRFSRSFELIHEIGHPL